MIVLKNLDFIKKLKRGDIVTIYLWDEQISKFEPIDSIEFDVICNDYFDILNFVKETMFYNSEFPLFYKIERGNSNV